MSTHPILHPIDSSLAQADYPLSSAQERLWFLYQLYPDGIGYNEVFELMLKGRVDIPLLEQSVAVIIDRHEILRTKFVMIGHEPRQIIKPAIRPILRHLDLRNTARMREERESLILAETRQCFDLEKGDLFRITIVTLREDLHLVVFAVHHIVCDGWSARIFCEELAAIYRDLADGKPISLHPPAVQFKDFAVWERQMLDSPGIQQELDRWKHHLKDIKSVPIAADYARPLIPTFRAGSCDLRLSGSLKVKLKDLSKSIGTTLSLVLLATLKVLLGMSTQERDITIGVPIAGRYRPDFAGLIGHLVNTLVLRSELGKEMSFRSLLLRDSADALQAYARQHLPIDRLIQQLDLGRHLHEIVNVLWLFETAWEKPYEMSGVAAFGMRETVSPKSAFDLEVCGYERSESIHIILKYNEDILSRKTAERLLRRWKNILESIAIDPDKNLAELMCVDAGERRQVLEEWNSTKRGYGDKKCVHELFEEQAERKPDAVAVVFDDQRLTYKELNRRANQLAHYLQKQETGPEMQVGICMERSLEIVIGLLAIMKAGGAYVPLDPTYPADRLGYMAQDAQLSMVITEARFRKHLPGGMKLLCLDEVWEHIAAANDKNLKYKLAEESLAYVIYTSGSTGKPKGAMNRHGSLRNRLQWMQEEYKLNEEDGVLQKTPFTFDVSVWEFFWPLVMGAQLVMAKPEGHRDSAYLAGLIEQEQASTIHFVPTMLHAFLQAEQVEQKCVSLKRVFCSGEALGTKLAQECMKRMKAELHNLYGPTEAAIDVTYWICERETRRATTPIGQPIANTQMYVLDENMSPTGIGAPGELYIGGVGLGRGYWQRAGLTGEKFVPDPFSVKGGERLYRTGDRGRWMEEGVLEYLGRLDQQVKIRGYRIELGEIEAVLEQHEGVKQAAVAVREEGAEGVGKKLVGYVVMKERGGLSVSGLRSYLQERLPEYMVPQEMVELEEMPLLVSGKLDRKSLPELAEARRDWKSYAAPRTGVEEILAGIWEQVLRREKIGIEDNFFELGGHSLLATQVKSRIQSAFNLELPLQLFFDIPTVAGLAAEIEKRQGAGEWLKEPRLVVVQNRKSYPL